MLEYEIALRNVEKWLGRLKKAGSESRVSIIHNAVWALNDLIEELHFLAAEIESNAAYASAILADLSFRWGLEGFREEDFQGRYNPGPPSRWVLSIPYAPESIAHFELSVGKRIKTRLAVKDLWDKLVRQALPSECATFFEPALCCFEYHFKTRTAGRVRDADNCSYVETPILNALRRVGVLYDDCDVMSVRAGFPSEKPRTLILVMGVEDPSSVWEDFKKCLSEEGFWASGVFGVDRFRGLKTLDNAVIKSGQNAR